MTSKTFLLMASAMLLSGCFNDDEPAVSTSNSASVEIKGSDPASAAPSAAPSQGYGFVPESGAPSSTGIVTYDGYHAALARDGDTVSSVAARIGLSAAELGAYNGLAPDHPLRSGDELVLPPRPGGYDTGGQQFASADGQIPSGSSAGGTSGWSPDVAAAAIDRAGTGIDAEGNLNQPPSAAQPLPPAPVAPGELNSPQLRQYQTPTGGEQVALADPASGTAQGTAVSSGVAAEVEPLDVTPEPVTGETAVPVPVPVPAPLPAEENPVELKPEPAVTVAPAAEPKPEPQPVQTAAASGEFRLLRPVTGPIVKRFGQGQGNADGIDFASPSGAPVIASAAGEVALVSKSLGGLGTIVLVRHPDDYLTVYGRIEKVTVGKGDLVSQGQRIGVVTPSAQPRMHFELRRGAEGLDPERYF